MDIHHSTKSTETITVEAGKTVTHRTVEEDTVIPEWALIAGILVAICIICVSTKMRRDLAKKIVSRFIDR